MKNESNKPQTTWDYTSLAAHYDRRADYSDDAIDKIIALTKPPSNLPIADVGAGTAKLTKLLLARGYEVRAVEPNDAMRSFGIKNTEGQNVTWSVGTGEETGLPSDSFGLVTFGSSFNVTDRLRTLSEVQRLLVSRGWFACMWNHRDLNDPIQAKVEGIIQAAIPAYDYGTRRQDQTAVIRESGLFDEPVTIEGTTTNTLPAEDYIDAWRSHATLQRQAGDAFAEVVASIERALEGMDMVSVPYTTRVWCAQLAE